MPVIFAFFFILSLVWNIPITLAANAYISNEKDNTVSIIDTDSMVVVATVKVGRRPRGIIMSADESQVYICASDDDRVEVRKATDLSLLHYLPSGPDPELFILDPDGRTLYIANEDDNFVTVVDVVDKMVIDEIPVGVEPEGMALSPNGNVLVNTSETTNMAHFIDTGSLEIIENIVVDARPRVAIFNTKGDEVWVSSEVGGTVSVIDPETHTITKKISFNIPGVNAENIQPVGVRLTTDGRYAFVALGPANRVAVIDQKTKEILKYILVGQRVWQLYFTADEKTLLTTNGLSNDVTAIDIDRLKATRSTRVGRFPWGVVIAHKTP